MKFSLFYFASDSLGDGRAERYDLLLQGARFADDNGLSAVWMPERHFERFGGLFPNPAITAAALSQITHRVQLRAGSVVAPLHSPIRIAEDWAMIDNLSHGRVALSFAPGWVAADFAIAPDAYDRRRDIMRESLDLVRRLWRGETVTFPDGDGTASALSIRPEPVQHELPVWLTTGGKVLRTETSELAGSLGVNVLTNFVSQSFDHIGALVNAYRRARAAANHDPATGIFTLALHCFVTETFDDSVEETVRAALVGYLRDSVDLVASQSATGPSLDAAVAQRTMDRLLNRSASRYIEEASLIGNLDHCRRIVERAREVGVDELACFVDFGLPVEDVLAALPGLARLARSFDGSAS